MRRAKICRAWPRIVGPRRWASSPQPWQITAIAMDMSPAYIVGVGEHSGQVCTVFDNFHTMQLAGKALDKVRKELARQGAGLDFGPCEAMSGHATKSANTTADRAHGNLSGFGPCGGLARVASRCIGRQTIAHNSRHGWPRPMARVWPLCESCPKRSSDTLTASSLICKHVSPSA
jgi:hypothetical protein